MEPNTILGILVTIVGVLSITFSTLGSSKNSSSVLLYAALAAFIGLLLCAQLAS